MHNVKDILDDVDSFKSNLQQRNFDVSIIDQLIKLNESRKKLTTEVETIRAENKKLSNQVGELKKKGENADELMEKVAKSKNQIATKEDQLTTTEEKQHDILLTIPNLCSDDVPQGKSEEDNVEISSWGEPRKFSFTPKDHVELGEKLGGLDFETAAKVTGSRFVFYKGAIARLERALANYMLNEHINHGYTEYITPYIAHERALVGTGQLPKFKEDLFKLEGTDWYLIPTAEVTLTNLKREQIFSIDELPIKATGFTPCFRSEAGSYGKDTKGLIRLHQFHKVELVNIVAPEESIEAHKEMVARAQAILEALELPYKAISLCSGDIGFAASKTIDLEVWLPGQNKYREISSISNCGAFQARRAGIRFKRGEGKPEFAHTLNGSGLAVGRTLVAILENYQNADGTIDIPAVLIPYMGGLEKITKQS